MEPRTITERLDAAQTGTEFGQVITDLFAARDRTRDTDDNQEDDA